MYVPRFMHLSSRRILIICWSPAYLLDRLPYADGASWDPHRTCLSGTRVGLLRDIESFTMPTSPSPVRILLLTGVFGSGKSAIAHTISSMCKDAGTLVTSFMFDRNVSERNTPSKLFTTIARDLCVTLPNVARAMLDVMTRNPSVATAPIARQFRELIIQTTSSLPFSLPLIIIIDAIDEIVREDQLDDLLHVLSRDCGELAPNFRMIITSRTNPNVLDALSSASHIETRELSLDDEENLGDIAAFSRHRLEDIAQKRKLGKTWPSPHLVDAFIKKAEGLYIWVETVYRSIRYSTEPTLQLQRLVQDRPYFNLPVEEKMAELYSTILSVCPWDDEDFTSNYQVVLGTVLALKTPLPTSAIQSLLQIQVSVENVLRPLNAVLAGVSKSSDGNRIVQICHKSFRDFSTRRDVAQLSDSERRYCVDVPQQNSYLALCILRTLNYHLPLLSDPLVPVVSSVKHTPQDIPILPPGCVSEVVWYCCQFWMAHVQALLKPEPTIFNALDELLTKNLSSWVLVCASKGQVQEMEGLRNWYQVTVSPIISCGRVVDYTPTDSWAHDALA